MTVLKSVISTHICLLQNAGLVPIVEPEILLDGDHDINRCLEVAEATWAETFKYLADNKVCQGLPCRPDLRHDMLRSVLSPCAVMCLTWAACSIWACWLLCKHVFLCSSGCVSFCTTR